MARGLVHSTSMRKHGEHSEPRLGMSRGWGGWGPGEGWAPQPLPTYLAPLSSIGWCSGSSYWGWLTIRPDEWDVGAPIHIGFTSVSHRRSRVTTCSAAETWTQCQDGPELQGAQLLSEEVEEELV